MVLQFEDVVDCLKKNQISILQAAAIPDDDGTRLTRITATLGYSRGHHGYIFSCSTRILQLRLVMLWWNRCREDDCSAGKTLDP